MTVGDEVGTLDDSDVELTLGTGKLGRGLVDVNSEDERVDDDDDGA